MNKYDKEIIKIVLTAILTLVLVSVVITFGIIKYSNSHYSEESTVIAQVDNKYNTPYFNIINGIYICNYYYYVVSDDKKLNVSERVYYNTKIGDNIKIKVITIYSKKNNEICRQEFKYEGATE